MAVCSLWRGAACLALQMLMVCCMQSHICMGLRGMFPCSFPLLSSLFPVYHPRKASPASRYNLSYTHSYPELGGLSPEGSSSFYALECTVGSYHWVSGLACLTRYHRTCSLSFVPALFLLLNGATTKVWLIQGLSTI